jgi:hypothetical protein
MRNLISKLVFCAAAAVMLGVASGEARADGIVFMGQDPCFPAGVGRGCGSDRSPHVLSIQGHTTASGSVGRSTSSPTTDVKTDDWQRGSNTQTVSLTEIGTTQASDIRIYYDINEPNTTLRRAVSLNSLVLNAYNDAGQLVFSASLVSSPAVLDEVGNGQGHSDYVFGLDATAAAQLQAAIAANQGNIRLGLSASVSSAEGGPESFFIGAQPAAVPEPATMILLGTGLAGVAARARKRRKGRSDQT